MSKRAERHWARQIPDDVAKRAQVVFATDYDALAVKSDDFIERVWAAIGENPGKDPVPHIRGLHDRIRELEAALREIADFSEQFIGDDEDGDERMYKVNQIADTALALCSPSRPDNLSIGSPLSDTDEPQR